MKEEKILIKEGRDNLSLTIFIPWDCNKNCPFCTTKSSYSKELADIDSIIKLAKKTLLKIPSIKDIVISGGEPLDNLKSLLKLIKNLEPYNKKIYINTSFPIIDKEGESTLKKILKKVSGINISRHVEHDYSDFSSLSYIKDFVQDLSSVRINILLNDHIDILDLSKSRKILDSIESIKEFDYFDIQLRANYLKTGTDFSESCKFNLKDKRDDTNLYLSLIGDIKTSYCSVCFTSSIVYNSRGNTISYHKGLRKTKLFNKTHKFYEVNDVIITPQGTLKLDWEDDPIDLDKILLYRKTIRVLGFNKSENTCGFRRTRFC